MKRILAFCLVFLCVFFAFDPSVYAAEPAAEESEGGFGETLLSQYSCRYDRDEKRILLSGTVKHDVLITHKEYRLDIYRIPPGKTYEAVVGSPSSKPLISTEISVRFEFSLEAEEIFDRFSHYAVVLRAPSGESVPACAPQRAELSSDYVAGDPSAFKGLISSEVSLGGNLGTGTAVVPVYLDRLFNHASRGYIYTFGDRILYFDKEYIDALDRSVRTYSSTGSRVYLQLLLNANGSELALSNGSEIGAVYDMPNVYSEDVLSKVSAVGEFLAERYSSHQAGRMHGVILGSAIDDPMMNYCGNLTTERYAQIYALYLTALADSVRRYNSSADIMIPFSSENSYLTESTSGASYHCGQLLEAILRIQDESFSIPFSCSVLVGIESDQNNATRLTVDSIDVYDSYFTGLAQRFESAPVCYSVYWDVPDSMGPTAMCANYAYSYYKLFAEPNVSAFFISFRSSETEGSYRLSELKETFRYIDTKDSLSVTSPLISYFGRSSWDEVIDGASARDYSVRTEYLGDCDPLTDGQWSGSFSYLEFSDGVSKDWALGSSAISLKAEYDRDGARSLKGVLRGDSSEAYGELLCLYEFPERFVHTPYLRVRLSVSGENAEAGDLYRVMITLGNDEGRTVVQQIVRDSDEQSIWLNMGQYPSDALVTYFKISVCALEPSTQEISVSLHDLVGYSEEYTSEELSDRIEADRLAIRNLSAGDGDTDAENLWWILGVVVLGLSVFIGIYICFKKDDRFEES